MGEVPARHPRGRRPALEVERVAALEDHPVHRRGSAEDLAPGVGDPPSVHERLGLGRVAPVVEAAADREGERRRHVDEDVEAPVGPAGLEDEDARPGIRRQAIGEGAPRRSAADDDVVDLLGWHGRMLSRGESRGWRSRRVGQPSGQRRHRELDRELLAPDDDAGRVGRDRARGKVHVEAAVGRLQRARARSRSRRSRRRRARRRRRGPGRCARRSPRSGPSMPPEPSRSGSPCRSRSGTRPLR